MKSLLFSILFSITEVFATAQQSRIDTLFNRLSLTENDTLRMIYCDILAWEYTEIRADSSIYFFKKTVDLAQKFDYRLNEASALNGMGYANYIVGDYSKSLEVLLKASKIAANEQSIQNILPGKFFAVWNIPFGVTLLAHAQYPEKQRKNILAITNQILGHVYGFAMRNIKKQLNYYGLSKELAE